MILEITKVRLPKESQTEGVYLMVEMRDTETGKWYKTYINPMYRNFSRWRKIARVGNEIFFRNFKLKTDDIIDADSRPLLFEGRRNIKKFQPEQREYSDKELFELGVFG